jgi:hypothetical protein
VVPGVLPDMLMDPDREKVERVIHACMQTKKFDLAALQKAFAVHMIMNLASRFHQSGHRSAIRIGTAFECYAHCAPQGAVGIRRLTWVAL